MTSRWSRVSGPGKVEFTNSAAPQTSVKLHGAGKYVLKLRATDGRQNAESTVTILVEPFQAKVTRSLNAADNAYIEGDSVFVNQHLKVEGKRRISIVKFDLKGLPPKLLDARLRLTGGADFGRGMLRVFRGSHSDWIGSTLTKKEAPTAGKLFASQSVNVSQGEVVTVPVLPMVNGEGIYTFIIMLDERGNDIWFRALGSGHGPRLLITFEDPHGEYDSFGEHDGR